MSNDFRVRWDLLTVAVFLTFSVWAPLFAIPPMETILAGKLAISHFQSGLLFSGPVIMLAAAAIPAGLIADKIGLKKAIGIGAILAFIGAALRGTASGYTSLLLYSLIFGLGLGFAFANLPKLAKSWGPPNRTVLTMGILNGGGVMAGIGVALAITVPLLYPLTDSYSGVFYIWSIPLLIAAILWWTMVPEYQHTPVKVATEKAPSMGLKQLFSNKILWLLAILLFLHNFVFYSWTGWIPTYLLEKGFSADIAGLTTSIMLWVSLPTVILIPLLTSRINFPQKLFIWVPSVVYVILTVSILFASPVAAWFIMGISGFVNVLRFNILLVLPVEFVPSERAGAASGMVVALGYTGAVLGPIISGWVLDLSSNFTLIFGGLAVISLFSALFTFLIPKAER
jgi:CP family cyanate transporter-like MFS transporter